jgi:HEAT repeat protein
MSILIGAAPIVEFAFWLGVTVAVMTLVMLTVTIIMQRTALRSQQIDARALALWKPIIVAVPSGAPAAVPKLTACDVSGFIRVWNEIHEPLRGGTTDNLARIALEVGLAQRLHRFLQTTAVHDRLRAVIALGHVRSSESFSLVLQYLDDKSPIMSLCAARSLMQIDPTQAVSKLVPRIVRRTDWSQGGIASILQESGAASISRQLTEATLHANAEIAPRLIRFLAAVSPASAAPIIREALRSSTDERMVSTCLQAMSNPADLDCVRPLLCHPRWHLRMQAAVTLGNLGIPGDEQRLIAMLSDSHWWVRYRAAHALMNLRFIKIEHVRRLQQAQTDPYAQDITNHVLAERAIGAMS